MAALSEFPVNYKGFVACAVWRHDGNSTEFDKPYCVLLGRLLRLYFDESQGSPLSSAVTIVDCKVADDTKADSYDILAYTKVRGKSVKLILSTEWEQLAWLRALRAATSDFRDCRISSAQLGNKSSWKLIGSEGSGMFSVLLNGTTPVAVKHMETTSGQSQLQIERANEVALLLKMHSPCLQSFYGICSLDGAHYMVTELCRSSLATRLFGAGAQAFTDDELSHVALEICGGLCYLHTHKVVHRRLNPSNILFSQSGSAKICNFGNAGVGAIGEDEWAFQSPEQLQGLQATTKADVYSFGIILHCMKTLKPPYSEAQEDTLSHHIRPQITRNFPPFLAGLCGRCWQEGSENRPSSTACLQYLQNPQLLHPEQTKPIASAVDMLSTFSSGNWLFHPSESKRFDDSVANGPSLESFPMGEDQVVACYDLCKYAAPRHNNWVRACMAVVEGHRENRTTLLEAPNSPEVTKFLNPTAGSETLLVVLQLLLRLVAHQQQENPNVNKDFWPGVVDALFILMQNRPKPNVLSPAAELVTHIGEAGFKELFLPWKAHQVLEPLTGDEWLTRAKAMVEVSVPVSRRRLSAKTLPAMSKPGLVSPPKEPQASSGQLEWYAIRTKSAKANQRALVNVEDCFLVLGPGVMSVYTSKDKSVPIVQDAVVVTEFAVDAQQDEETVPCIEVQYSSSVKDKVMKAVFRFVLKYESKRLELLRAFHACREVPAILDEELPQSQLSPRSEWNRIGAGACGVVFKAHIYSTVPVAIKTFNRRGDKDQLTEFLLEVSVLRIMRHPCLLTFYGMVSPSKHNIFMLITELCDPMSLRDRIYTIENIYSKPEPKPRIENAEFKRIAIELCAGLAFLHSHDIIHRDLKPENILFSSGQVKIVDFGQSVAGSNVGQNAMRTANTVGTPIYRAPEMTTRTSKKIAQYSAAVDVYAFAITFWEMFVRQIPFEDLETGEFTVAFDEAIANGARPAIPSDMPSKLSSLICRAWSSDPISRPSAEDMLEEWRGDLFQDETFDDTAAKNLERLVRTVAEGSWLFRDPMRDFIETGIELFQTQEEPVNDGRVSDEALLMLLSFITKRAESSREAIMLALRILALASDSRHERLQGVVKNRSRLLDFDAAESLLSILTRVKHQPDHKIDGALLIEVLRCWSILAHAAPGLNLPPSWNELLEITADILADRGMSGFVPDCIALLARTLTYVTSCVSVRQTLNSLSGAFISMFKTALKACPSHAQVQLYCPLALEDLSQVPRAPRMLDKQRFRVVLLGPEGVGKTSLSKRFAFNIFQSQSLSTLRDDIFCRDSFEVERDKFVDVRIWDTVGQERDMTSLASTNIVRKSQAVILVYDVTKPNTLGALKDFFKMARLQCDMVSVLFVVAGNKLDLETKTGEFRATCEAKNLREISRMRHFYVSAKTGEHVEELFKGLCRDLLNSSARANPHRRGYQLGVGFDAQRKAGCAGDKCSK